MLNTEMPIPNFWKYLLLIFKHLTTVIGNRPFLQK